MRLNLKNTITVNGKKYLLSTVELPYFSFNGAYETMVFPVSDKGLINYIDVYEQSYDSEEDAIQNHKKLLGKMKKGIRFWED